MKRNSLLWMKPMEEIRWLKGQLYSSNNFGVRVNSRTNSINKTWTSFQKSLGQYKWQQSLSQEWVMHTSQSLSRAVEAWALTVVLRKEPRLIFQKRLRLKIWAPPQHWDLRQTSQNTIPNDPINRLTISTSRFPRANQRWKTMLLFIQYNPKFKTIISTTLTQE